MKTIYKITNLKNGKCYIGATVNMYDRKRYHKYAMNKKNDNNLYSDMREYGFENFIFTELLVVDEKNWEYWEKRIIKLFGSTDPEKGYNISSGGQGPLGMIHSEKTREKMSKSSKRLSGKEHPNYGKIGELNYFYGKKHTKETRAKMRKSWENRVVTNETKMKMSECKTGEKHPRYRPDIDNEMIQELRKEGLSQKEISNILGCGQNTISRRLNQMEKVNG